MRFSMYDSARSQQGYLCTYDKYIETDADRRGEMKKRLPVIGRQGVTNPKK